MHEDDSEGGPSGSAFILIVVLVGGIGSFLSDMFGGI